MLYPTEVGMFFKSIGFDVHFVAVRINDVTQNFLAERGIKIYRVDELPTDDEYDIIWAHHFPILPYLIERGLKYKLLVNSCMSEFLSLERPLFFKENIDLILVLTDNLKLDLQKNYGFSDSLIMTLPNTAPDEFFAANKKLPLRPKKVAVVSNHPPTELQNLEYDYYGAWCNNSVNITPELLTEYDVIVSIGKTVQYALAMGIPVYNYDHFGGSGYITPGNIEIEEAHNFSGRSFHTKKTAKQIQSEIILGYSEARKAAKKLKQIALSRYKLSVRLTEILETLNNLAPKPNVKITSENRLYFDYCKFIIEYALASLPQQDTGGWQIQAIAQRAPRGLARLWHHIKTMKF